MSRAQIDPAIRDRIRRSSVVVQRRRRIPQMQRIERTGNIFHESFLEMAYKLALLGLTDEEMAKFFEVSSDTVDRWKQTRAGFRDAMLAGRVIADTEVVESLRKRALGYSHPDVKIFYNKDTGEIIKVPFIKHYPPDTAAGMFWLRARWRDQWSVPTAPDDDPSGAPKPPTILFNPVTVKVLTNSAEPPTIDSEAA